MLERLSEISKEQSLEEQLRVKEDFTSLPYNIKSLVWEIEELKNPLLSCPQRERVLIFILWMDNPSPKQIERIANLLGKETKEIKEQINFVFEKETQEFDEAIFILTNHGEREISWNKKNIPQDGKFREKVKQLRNEGCERAVIAEKLGEPVSRVKYAIQILLRKGEIERWKRPRSQETIEFDKKVKQLKEQGFEPREIALILGKRRYLVYEALHRLRKAGEIK